MTRHSAAALVALLVSATHSAAQTPAVPWTRGATCYEVFVRSFQDSDGDGIGDLKGLTARLDYINDGDPHSLRSLGAKCIWLMPVAESPSYHGYDVTDYYRVEHDYGTNDDFKELVAAAHRRGIKVLVDMVLNHTSSEHPFFQQALHDTASPYRAWFRWSPTKPTELNPWGQSNWHKSPARDEWYYGFFWSGMPDLNYQHPPVVAEAKKIARFWLTEMGVDGFRLDAVPYLVEEPGKMMNTAATHAVLRDYERYARSVKPDVFTVGEVTEKNDVLLTYYPDQLDSYFAFEVADSIISGVRNGRATGIMPPVLSLQRGVPQDRWAPFLRNHDQTRTRTELRGDMRSARVAALLVLTMPGMPFVYYGEEIGMIGSKPDERLRTPMQWNVTAGTAGFTKGKPWERLQDDSAGIAVELQDDDSTSLLNWYRRLIHLRSATPALARGRLIPLTASDSAVSAYLRRDGDHVALVIVNLSGSALQHVSLTSAERALPAGGCTVRSLLGGANAAALRVGTDGRLRNYIPLATLAPKDGYIFELSACTKPR